MTKHWHLYLAFIERGDEYILSTLTVNELGYILNSNVILSMNNIPNGQLIDYKKKYKFYITVIPDWIV